MKEEIENLRTAAEQGDANALEKYRLLANQGNLKAQFRLGVMYGMGKGVVKDSKEAVKWYLMVAKEFPSAKNRFRWLLEYFCFQHFRGCFFAGGDEDVFCQSLLNLAYIYYNGEGVTQDYQEAFKWYLIVAKRGYSDGQYAVGKMYHEGKGVTQDHQEAAKWYYKAAKQGHIEARDVLEFEEHLHLFEPYLKGYYRIDALKWLIIGSMLIVVGIFFESRVLIFLGFGAGLISLIPFLFNSAPSQDAKWWVFFLIFLVLSLT